MKAKRFILPHTVSCKAHQLAAAVQCLPHDAVFQYASFDNKTAETSMVFTHETYVDTLEGAEFPVERFGVMSTGTIYVRDE